MIKENEIEESLHQRARIIVDFELTGNVSKAPRFMHTLELVAEVRTRCSTIMTYNNNIMVMFVR